jgi:indolepyruvate decarboxylase
MHIKEEHLVRVDMNIGTKWQHGDAAKNEILTPAILLNLWDKADPPSDRPSVRPSYSPKKTSNPFVPRDVQITISRLIEAIGNVVDDKSIVLAEAGDALFAAADLHLPLENQFLANGFWASLGFVLPGAIGAYFSNRENRPIVLIGDGAFVMSAIEMATLARYSIPAMVIIFDNKGYGTERPMINGAFNDVQPVDHVMLGKAYGFKAGKRVATEGELWEGLKELKAVEDGPIVLSVSLDMNDRSEALKNLTAALGKRMK